MKLVLTLLALTTAAAAQTTPAKPATAHTATTTSSTAKAGTVVNPPGLPKIVGVPKTLYALKYVDIKVGTGPLAMTRKFYTVNYTGWFPDGKKFDASADHGGPATFPIGAGRVIWGWETGFEGMHVGGKRRLFVPWELAYGEFGRPGKTPADGIPPKKDLIFDVEIVSISDKPPTPPTPPAGAPGSTPKPGAPAGVPNGVPRPGAPASPTTPGAPPSAPAPGTAPAINPSAAPATKPGADPTAPTTAPASPTTPPPAATTPPAK